MKIKNVTDSAIIFDNGNMITYNHIQECCEDNYADFSILDENNINYSFDFNEDLSFKLIDGSGFMFGSADEHNNMHWIFIPCYSCQNGYYTSEIDIYYSSNKRVLNLSCELHIAY